MILEITTTFFPLLISVIVGLNVTLEEKASHFQTLLAVPNRHKNMLASLLREVEYMPCYADWRERRELKHLHICSGIILQMQDEKMDGN